MHGNGSGKIPRNFRGTGNSTCWNPAGTGIHIFCGDALQCLVTLITRTLWRIMSYLRARLRTGCSPYIVGEALPVEEWHCWWPVIFAWTYEVPLLSADQETGHWIVYYFYATFYLHELNRPKYYNYLFFIFIYTKRGKVSVPTYVRPSRWAWPAQ